jgi:phage host-nuclease inhibitor protein Gam
VSELKLGVEAEFILAPDTTPATLSKASWVMEVLGDAERKKARARAMYEAAKKRLDDWLAGQERKLDGEVGLLRAELERWAELEKRALLGKGKTKSVDLPTGTLSWRRVGGRLKVLDKDALAAWCVEHGPDSGLYRLKVEPEVAKVQAHFKETGEIPPGTEWEQETDKLYVKPDLDGLIPVSEEDQ